MSQSTNTLLMIKPIAFSNNKQTAINNHFQKSTNNSNKNIQSSALKEFNTLVEKLEKEGVKIIILEDTIKPETPDAIFPNNWISFHENNTACVYPMFSENRRDERRNDIFETVEKEGFKINNIIDYTSAENQNIFLEGTGSMVLDRENKVAYCALSPRSNEELFIEFCEDLEYTPIVFRASHQVSGKRKPIYHTNVMMSIGNNFALICLQTIDDKKQRKQVAEMLQNSGKEIINISEEQVANFAGNILQVKNKEGEYLIVMSTTAKTSLSNAQLAILKKHGKIIDSDVKTIEENGGGSVRCMLAELF